MLSVPLFRGDADLPRGLGDRERERRGDDERLGEREGEYLLLLRGNETSSRWN
jgi:hypothetical protein